MKKALFIAAICAATILSGCANSPKEDKKAEDATPAEENVQTAKGGIVYVQLDRIIAEYDMANDLRSVVEAKVNSIQQEVNRRGQKLESEIATYQEKVQKGLMTQSTARAQGEQLQKKEQEFNEYAQLKSNEVNEEQQVMMNQIADAIQSFIDKYNEEKQYDMILTNTAGTPVITANPSLNITDEVLKGLNDEYIKTKNNK
ncbi:MAG: OmpH family outer membrane protein [Bacteroidales bacterium]|nr:OmpH family outer membrane protein [Bacteroidales bacterium]